MLCVVRFVGKQTVGSHSARMAEPRGQSDRKRWLPSQDWTPMSAPPVFEIWLFPKLQHICNNSLAGWKCDFENERQCVIKGLSVDRFMGILRGHVPAA